MSIKQIIQPPDFTTMQAILATIIVISTLALVFLERDIPEWLFAIDVSIATFYFTKSNSPTK